jgi:hypothetical protein
VIFRKGGLSDEMHELIQYAYEKLKRENDG